MKVGIFYSSFGKPEKFPNKVALMDNFAAGVRTCGDVAVDYRSTDISNLDIDAGFVLGYTLENNFRRRIIDSLAARNIPRVFVDSNILHYARPEHDWHRYSVNSVYPDSGVYFFSELDKDKWHNYSTWHGVSEQPWRLGHSGQHILILCQRPHGWNMFGNDQLAWLDHVIGSISAISNRPIRVRMHPGDGTKQNTIDEVVRRWPSIGISTNANIVQDLADCWCAVGYNSTPNAVAAIQGVPVYVQDPIHSWAADVAFTDLRQIVDPPMPDRTVWLNKIANIHWNNSEVRSGKLWAAIKNYILTSR